MNKAERVALTRQQGKENKEREGDSKTEPIGLRAQSQLPFLNFPQFVLILDLGIPKLDLLGYGPILYSGPQKLDSRVS